MNSISKALKVIYSCETIEQIITAHQFVKLVLKREPIPYNLLMPVSDKLFAALSLQAHRIKKRAN